ncbi:MAG: hotdog fold thioesterase [Alphaproteobacteria bacterium]|nr:hotdog fold thioesterase [Alphaproteobacteria bacterium]
MEIDFENFRHLMLNGSPHMAAVGLELLTLDENGITGKMPHRPEFVGDPDTGVVHGGVVTVLLDSLSGMCIIPTLGEMMTIATLDLRIDYLKPAAPRLDIFAQVHCYKTTRNIAFTRGIAYQKDIDDPIAHATGSFMLTRLGNSETGTVTPA